MDDARIVQQQQRPGLGHGEALAIGTIGFKHAGLSALDAPSAHQKNRNQVHPVAVRVAVARTEVFFRVVPPERAGQGAGLPTLTPPRSLRTGEVVDLVARRATVTLGAPSELGAGGPPAADGIEDQEGGAGHQSIRSRISGVSTGGTSATW